MNGQPVRVPLDGGALELITSNLLPTDAAAWDPHG